MTDDLEELERIAQRLWPDDEYLRQEWLHAVYLVRSTQRGWVLDTPLTYPSDQALAS